MVGFVKLLGIAMVILGVIYLIKPATMKRYATFWMKDNRIYAGGVISVVIALIFFRAAGLCSTPWFVVLMGILALAKGACAFFLGPKKIKPWMEQLMQKPIGTLRTIALIPLIIGILLIYAA
ncbi:MAG: DUF2065 family protein [Candidatus Omnitrophota bacterium]|nr:MAG: DUF2065 family protein [Candidatus Omnitrophota bacterium]